MALSKQDIEYVAKLARIKLTSKESEELTEQLSVCLDYFEMINAIDTSNIEPTSQANNLVNVTREDVVNENMSVDDVLKNAPEHFEGFIRIPKVID
ncbi:MAG: Asp-tRNA(Asn)/Glu-tRNA(Gln) amidotransferase subunit GatC [Dehalococcoidia bacterium]|nr:Asp-tRNA(Asn)/Glu-tRNA(Gln) amidotransferase subunit GatC [Dehalococcoidia bacterium]